MEPATMVTFVTSRLWPGVVSGPSGSSQCQGTKACHPESMAGARFALLSRSHVTAACLMGLCAIRRWRRSRRAAMRGRVTESADGIEVVKGGSLFSEAMNDDAPLDMLPSMQLTAEEKEKNRAPEPEEPAQVLEVREDLVMVRAGKGCFLEDKPGTVVYMPESACDAVLLAWKEDIAALHILAGDPEPGEEVFRTEESKVFTKCHESLRGRILDFSGKPLDGKPLPPIPMTQRNIFEKYKEMMERTNRHSALFTGVQGIDFSAPIGRGQTMLFQGSECEMDRRELWPDLMASQPSFGSKPGPAVNVAVCRTVTEAEELQRKLEARGCWDTCTIFVPISELPGAGMLALNAAMAFAEYFCEADGEAMVLCEFLSMHNVWNVLADVAGKEREARGILLDPKEEEWVQMQGTVVRESIAERRKFWFDFVSRAVNDVNLGSVTLLPWLWEQEGGYSSRLRKAYDQKLKDIAKISRIGDDIRAKMVEKVKEEAQKAGIDLESEDDTEYCKARSDGKALGVPNWEIEELKSITDGHILLRPPTDAQRWTWRIDAYKSLPRLGTEALHPALISVDSPKLRLKMMQGRDRADILKDTLGASGTLDENPAVQLEFVEVILEQPAGQPFSVDQEVARMVIVADPSCKRLKNPESAGGLSKVLDDLTEELLSSEAGKLASADIQETGEVSAENFELLAKEVASWQ
eukprot:TRINITY_DN63134_c0_g1_i1.p1 TRINITY_DN63134_c0_g1~~TRINITY_DN63134_c0_g1_i1.p1  ORF type:complete len:694 (-),score=163.03 TRINITY_DN63134_c0_g1_i1:31-2112(-)